MGANSHPTTTVERVTRPTVPKWAIHLVVDGEELYTGLTVTASSESEAQESAERSIELALEALNVDTNVKDLYDVKVKQYIV